MQALIEFAPLAAFLAAYYTAGFYVATAVLMGGMLLLVAYDLLRTRRIPVMHAASTLLVFVFGTATLVLHDQRFIQWKPTVFFWALALAFLGSAWIGPKPLAQRLLEAALGSAARIDRARWLRLNVAWVLFYLVLGAVNLYVAWNMSERAWVNFKVFGLTLVTLVFVTIQAVWVSRQPPVAPPADQPAGQPTEPPLPTPQGTRPDAATIEAELAAAFEPAEVAVRDDSAAHAGHSGAREGGHFHVTVVSNRFVGLPTRERHRLIYSALGAWMGSGIHALSIEARPFVESKDA